MSRPLYVEACIRTDLDALWEATQDPARHQRWDLRFTEIQYLRSPDAGPQQFRYGVRVLGIRLSGTGVCTGERRRADGSRTSALRFASPHPLSLLAEGSGYWRYVPTDGGDGAGGSAGVRFLTGYDYRPRWGRCGRFADRVLFRPLMGWATAWSFDRLRLWLERGATPEQLRRRALAEAAARAVAVAATGVLTSYAVAFVGLITLLLLPPLPGTPAARRCVRRRPDSVTAPAILDRPEPLKPLDRLEPEAAS